MKINLKNSIISKHPKYLYFLVLVSLLAITIAQSLLVFDYFKTTRDGLIRESDAILQEVFKYDMENRHKVYKLYEKQVDITDTARYHFPDSLEATKYLLNAVDLAINMEISKVKCLHVNSFDSVANTVLQSRGINTDFYVESAVYCGKKALYQRSRNLRTMPGFLQVRSKPLTVHLEPYQTLTLVLVNPLSTILVRMGFMLVTSTVFMLLCLFGFWQLMVLLSKQRQLVSFKNDFLTNIAHELKRPVASLNFNLDMLLQPALESKPDLQREVIRRALASTNEMNATIQMLVTLAKMEEGLLHLHKKELNVKLLLEQIAEQFRTNTARKAEICILSSYDEPVILADEQLLGQCFSNLIDNAIKYSQTDVVILIRIGKKENCLIITVEDNGPGIPEDKLPLIFDKYTRVDSSVRMAAGFGIGLNYVKNIVGVHNGDVEVESKYGAGTKFSLNLPV